MLLLMLDDESSICAELSLYYTAGSVRAVRHILMRLAHYRMLISSRSQYCLVTCTRTIATLFHRQPMLGESAYPKVMVTFTCCWWLIVSLLLELTLIVMIWICELAINSIRISIRMLKELNNSCAAGGLESIQSWCHRLNDELISDNRIWLMLTISPYYHFLLNSYTIMK